MVRLVTSRDVRLVYTKYDGSLHWHITMRLLGQDKHGSWLGAPARHTARRGSEPPVTFDEAITVLVPRGQWWTATFYDAPFETEGYCDVSTPPMWRHPGEVTMVDLDLDVIWRRAGRQVVLLDEDEFAEHQVLYQYPAEVISRAQQTADWLQQAIKAEAEPFGSDYRPWLAQAR